MSVGALPASLEGLNPGDPIDGRSDEDGDWLTRGEEYRLGTSYNLADTDGDTLHDGEEVLLGTDPLDPNDPGSAPTPVEGATSNSAFRALLAARDSDGDGIDDATEIRNGTDPNDPLDVLPVPAQNCE